MLRPKDAELVRQESQILQRLDHPNILRWLASWEQQGKHYLITEYARLGNVGGLKEEKFTYR